MLNIEPKSRSHTEIKKLKNHNKDTKQACYKLR